MAKMCIMNPAVRSIIRRRMDISVRGGGAGGAAAAAAAVGKNSIIRAKLMYRSGKETVKNILLFNILI